MKVINITNVFIKGIYLKNTFCQQIALQQDVYSDVFEIYANYKYLINDINQHLLRFQVEIIEMINLLMALNCFQS